MATPTTITSAATSSCDEANTDNNVRNLDDVKNTGTRSTVARKKLMSADEATRQSSDALYRRLIGSRTAQQLSV